mgnify:CR=1 FL=1
MGRRLAYNTPATPEALPAPLPRGTTALHKCTKLEIIRAFRASLEDQFRNLEAEGRLANATETADIFAAILEFRLDN